MSATLTAVMIGFALFSLNSNRFAFILVGASIGQLAYGAYEDQRRLAALDVRIGAPVVLFIAYLSAYSIAYPFGHYYLYFSVASVFIFVIALYMELAILQLRLREAPAAFRALVA
jgi:hypothetical protein